MHLCVCPSLMVISVAMRAAPRAATSSPCIVYAQERASAKRSSILAGASMISASETPKTAARLLSAGAIAKGFKPEALHEYRDTDGKPIYWRIRARRDDGEKWMRPMTLNGHGYELREPDFAGKKPLYNLDRITAESSSTVWIVEG